FPCLRRCGAVLVGSVSVLVVLPAGVHYTPVVVPEPPVYIQRSAPPVRGVLVLLRERAGVLSDRSKLPRTVDPGAGEKAVDAPRGVRLEDLSRAGRRRDRRRPPETACPQCRPVAHRAGVRRSPPRRRPRSGVPDDGAMGDIATPSGSLPLRAG